MKISDLVSVVTGGASGLGEACVRTLVSRGGKVSIIDIAQERAAKLILDLGKNVSYSKADVTDENSVRDAIRKTIDAFGEIHAVLNCAGVATPGKVLGKDGLLPLENFEKVVRINLIGTINVIRHAVKEIVNNVPDNDGQRGIIINTSSGAAFEGQIGQSAYSASKAAIVGMTLPLAREFAEYGIRVVTIAPGLFHTPMVAGLPEKAIQNLSQVIPFPKRLGRPSEFAALAAHIIENPMLNGTTIRLDGALRMANK